MLYEKTKTNPWSETIKHRRLNWFGHMIRLSDDTPVKKALHYAVSPYKKPRGRPPLTWLSIMKKQLSEELKLSWEKACQLAKDRDVWKRYIQTIL